MAGRGGRIQAICVALLLTLVWGPAAASVRDGQTKSADDHFAEGFRLQRGGEHEKALEAYRAALRLDPKHFGALINSGILYMILGKPEDAVGAFKEAAAIEPRDALSHFNFGLAAQKLGRHDEAIEAFSRAINLKPDFGDAHRWLGSS